MLKQKLFVIISSLALVLVPVSVSARGLVPCGGYSNDAGTTMEKPCSVEDIFVLAAELINFLLATAGIVAVAFIVYRSFGLVLSAGNEEAVSKNKQGLSNAIIGFVIAMLAFVIVNTIITYVFGVKSFNLSNPKCYLNAAAPGCATSTTK
jgi:lysylphosphatidylglycerol synthetase-like protein (DUF2156 family)